MKITFLSATNAMDDAKRVAYKIGIKYVIQTATEHLNNFYELDEYIMGMGRYLFTIKPDRDSGHVPKCKLLEIFLNEWDSEFCFTGNPMRFKADGKIITNW